MPHEFKDLSQGVWVMRESTVVLMWAKSVSVVLNARIPGWTNRVNFPGRWRVRQVMGRLFEMR